MKIINETPDEITLSHPSKVRATLGVILAALGAILFLVTAIGFSNDIVTSIIGFLLFGAGLFIIFLNAYVTVHIDKNAKTVHHHKKSIAGKRTHSESFPVDDASRIEIRPSHKKRGTGPAEVFIVFSDGSEIQIDHAHKPAKESSTSTAERVAGFLNVSVHDLTK